MAREKEEKNNFEVMMTGVCVSGPYTPGTGRAGARPQPVAGACCSSLGGWGEEEEEGLGEGRGQEGG